MGRRRSFADLTYGLLIGGLAILAVTIIVAPVIIVLMTSFTEGQVLKFPPKGFSLDWYAQLFDPVKSRQIHKTAGNSLQIAAFSTLFGVVLATLASLGLGRSRTKLARVADSFFMSPLVLPGITFGLAALVYFSLLGFRPSIELMIAGHMIVTMPFILRTTTASLSQLDPALLDSSQSLGASWLYTLRRVTLPLIAPGIAAGAFLAFMASIDNVPVSLFPLHRAHGHAADPHVGHDGIDSRCASGGRLGRLDHRGVRADADHGMDGGTHPPHARLGTRQWRSRRSR